MPDNVSPEEKLLRLIRGQKRTAKNSAPSPVSPELKPVLKNRPAHSSFGLRLDYSLISRLMPLLLVVSFIYLLGVYLYPLAALRKIKLPQDGRLEKNTAPAPAVKEGLKPFEFYSAAAGGRSIFGAPVNRESRITAVKGQPESIKEINLVGIIAEHPPQAIIEDKKNQKTYTLSEGQSLGEFEILEIREGKVILSSKGGSYELDI